MRKKLKLEMFAQPDDTTCGPTSLHAIYNYYGDPITQEEVIKDIQQLRDGGGTLAVMLALHALKRGYKVTLYTYNLDMFDPTWFANRDIDIQEKLRLQEVKKQGNWKFTLASQSYARFIDLGGIIKFKPLSEKLLRQYLKRNCPIITGLSSTYLYNSSREDPLTCKDNDIEGFPSGHFVILRGIDSKRRKILIADPYQQNPIRKKHYYAVGFSHLMSAILLGVMTYDGNLLIIEPKEDTFAETTSEEEMNIDLEEDNE